MADGRWPSVPHLSNKVIMLRTLASFHDTDDGGFAEMAPVLLDRRGDFVRRIWECTGFLHRNKGHSDAFEFRREASVDLEHVIVGDSLALGLLEEDAVLWCAK